MTTTNELVYDPYDVEIAADPYPVFRRLREEAPLYYNPEHDFYAVSRYDDVERGLVDRETFISGRGGILELIKSGLEIPPGTLIFEDPPTHTVHRSLLSRVFTPKKMAALEPQIRDFCARALDPLVGSEQIDFIADLGAQMPMRVIGMLLGVPEEAQESVRDRADANIRTEPGKPQEYSRGFDPAAMFADFEEYLDLRLEHPADDLMSDLVHAEFTDENGVTRRLERHELLTYLSVIAGAGNETTTRLIGWAGKTLSDHPDQRRALVADPSLIPNAIEEILRFEPPAPHVGRYVARDVEIHGTTVPEGSAMLMLVGAANRDDRRFSDPDRFDVRREVGQHLTFGYGIHFCLGAALARLEGRIALEELLKRFPDWEVDMANARLAPTSTVRGWETLPAFVPARGGRRAGSS